VPVARGQSASVLRPVGGSVALSFEEAPFGEVGGQLDGAVLTAFTPAQIARSGNVAA
jgi:hypothetical protein